MVKRQMMTIAGHPHHQRRTARPYGGIENLRPESREIVETFMSWH
jgi:arylsulfatase